KNLVLVSNEMAQNPPRNPAPIIKTSNPSEAKSDKPAVAQDNKAKPWVNWPWSKNTGTTHEEPPLLEPRKSQAKGPATVDAKKPDGPILIENFPEPKILEVKKE